ncbi:DNA endonuclease SmrA [Salmonella enterica subsp. enterica serovar Choleraesuis]|nr:DNA endonuclease SmrA [Salmonella enterica subsp. enterica serovar Choleraesuis]
MNPDEKSLFLDAMADVQPLKSCHSLWLKKSNTRSRSPEDLQQLDNFLTTGYLDILPVSTPLEYRREGVQPGITDKLRRGKYPQQASLNLIRKPVEQCRQQLFTFIQEAGLQGLRNLLIVHGHPRSDDAHANIVRSYLSRWLPEFDNVQAFYMAQPQHGGGAACYVALQKSHAAREENWERHAKRSR